jgi:hypothetical protein
MSYGRHRPWWRYGGSGWLRESARILGVEAVSRSERHELMGLKYGRYLLGDIRNLQDHFKPSATNEGDRK